MKKGEEKGEEEEEEEEEGRRRGKRGRRGERRERGGGGERRKRKRKSRKTGRKGGVEKWMTCISEMAMVVSAEALICTVLPFHAAWDPLTSMLTSNR